VSTARALDGDAPCLSIVDLQDDPNDRWQAARYEAFKATDLHCQRCNAEHGSRVVKHIYTWDQTWEPFVIGEKRRPDVCVVDIHLVVVPNTTPWTGEQCDLLVLCMGCYFAEVVKAARERRGFRKVKPEPQLGLAFTPTNTPS
jgi:hypothetical protein